MKIYSILLLAGDGIGQEIMQEVKRILKFFEDKGKAKFDLKEGLIGGIAYDETGSPLPYETIDFAKKSDAVILGAVGGEKWDDGKVPFDKRPEAGLLGIRKELGLFANLRPAMVFDALAEASSLKKELVSGLDILIVRELTGGLYFGEPRGITIHEDGQKSGCNSLFYTEDEIRRIVKLAFELAQKRSKKLCSVDKANVLEVMRLWREIATDEGKNFPDIELSHMYVDNAAMQLVRAPKQFDVMVTENMFGDILSDCAAMMTGSIGMLPSASLGELDSNGKRAALYEPVHGSAPDIAGQNLANPIAQILSISMMFKFSLDLGEEAEHIEQAIIDVLEQGYRTKDIMQENMKTVSTKEMGDHIIQALENIYK